MHKIVVTCFKAIAYAIIFVIIWDVCFYLWRANAINQRMESLAVSLQEVVSKNNYLPEEDYKMFESLCKQTMDDMNQGDTFIRGFYINYDKHEAYCKDSVKVNVDGKGNVAKYKLDTPASYGDVQVIEIGVGINATFWNQVATTGNQGAADAFQKGDSPIEFTYTYLVPCLKYTTVTN